jgi:hypothetical protein
MTGATAQNSRAAYGLPCGKMRSWRLLPILRHKGRTAQCISTRDDGHRSFKVFLNTARNERRVNLPCRCRRTATFPRSQRRQHDFQLRGPRDQPRPLRARRLQGWVVVLVAVLRRRTSETLGHDTPSPLLAPLSHGGLPRARAPALSRDPLGHGSPWCDWTQSTESGHPEYPMCVSWLLCRFPGDQVHTVAKGGAAWA